MSARVLWEEDDGEVYEDTIPLCWIDKEKKIIRWPNKLKRGDTKKAVEECPEHEDDWKNYNLLKIKTTSGKYIYLYHGHCIDSMKMGVLIIFQITAQS